MEKTSLMSLLPLGLALLAGALIPIQASSGGALGKTLGSPLWGATVSLIVGAVLILAIALAFRAPAPQMAAAIKGPWWIWIGCVTGAIYVTLSLTLIPRIGAGNFIVCVVAGQLVVALMLDHYGLLGLAVKPATLPRVGGIILIFVGLVITQLGATPVSASTPDAPPSAQN